MKCASMRRTYTTMQITLSVKSILTVENILNIMNRGVSNAYCYKRCENGVIYSEWAYKSLIERKFYWKGATNDNRKIKYRI